MSLFTKASLCADTSMGLNVGVLAVLMCRETFLLRRFVLRGSLCRRNDNKRRKVSNFSLKESD